MNSLFVLLAAVGAALSIIERFDNNKRSEKKEAK